MIAELRTRLEALSPPGFVDALEQLIAEFLDERLSTFATSGSPWFGLDEAAAYLGISVRSLERRIAKGRVPSTTIGRRRLLHRDDLDALAANRGDGGGRSANHATPPPLGD